jgi:hypothetical protein
MRFYTNSHQQYCDIDLHTKTFYLSISLSLSISLYLSLSRTLMVTHCYIKNINANPEPFLNTDEMNRFCVSTLAPSV